MRGEVSHGMWSPRGLTPSVASLRRTYTHSLLSHLVALLPLGEVAPLLLAHLDRAVAARGIKTRPSLIDTTPGAMPAVHDTKGGGWLVGSRTAFTYHCSKCRIDMAGRPCDDLTFAPTFICAPAVSHPIPQHSTSKRQVTIDTREALSRCWLCAGRRSAMSISRWRDLQGAKASVLVANQAGQTDTALLEVAYSVHA